MEFLSTGVLTIKKDVYTDLFLVGGGGGGVMSSNINNGGGGGGYTKTVLNVLLNKGTYNIEIGAGGAGGTGDSTADGGATSITGNNGLFAAADGGKHAPTNTGSGGNGGSGGGGGAGKYGDIGTSGAGGEGGGAKGNSTTDATANTGGGGGGGKGYYDSSSPGGKGTAGGSGIVCIRLHQDDPTENVLSGTWKFNDTLTMPSALFTENFDYDGTLAYAGSSLYGVMGVQELSSNKDLCFGHNPGDLSANYVQVYRFTNNTWLQATAKTIKFWNRYQVVSPEFYAWFTANATKISD